mmetsp:Transcript_24190/g.23771  ORF Transcript_24190/g.23771 Transcript_24190/m.23771 type:complete len:98 (-) Transcript_24190:667-960(-)|eukprot:CAMPEP_0170550610 /NCGR_PEP_ID=MMETSP0211-20121228/8646_1 /TAXON_ID=311385 /ORGANISM="Pseudokeronopsis sp., Strain OXSARD2" /LENGTH=97 /DNA_ID=CAMNT_0010857243 /DNA_START=667 /DNA_END=960 /DNA_ORIENTATION=-
MAESMISLQKLLVKDSEQAHSIILYCIKMIDKIQPSSDSSTNRAKATMIYLLQEFIDSFPTLSKETLRRLIKGFCAEKDDRIKQQIMNLACEVITRN